MRNQSDERIARKAALWVLEEHDLCTCPIQVIRLAREVPQVFIDTMECDCDYCQMELQHEFTRWCRALPNVLHDFHRPGASAAVSAGEKRDDDLIGPVC